jgi:hypothetical protein
VRAVRPGDIERHAHAAAERGCEQVQARRERAKVVRRGLSVHEELAER